MHKKPPFKLL